MQFDPITPEECAKKVSQAQNITVLSGAGMSTSAGVPDFRGPKGIYVSRAYDPEATFDIQYFSRDPAPFFTFTRDFLSTIQKIEPTYTHFFLARLEKQKNISIITQNIDGLHQRAGSSKVFPMHGDYQTSHCRGCGRSFKYDQFLDLLEARSIPACPKCNAVVKPDVVFFGESVRYMQESVVLAQNADLFFVLGSSLTVYPASQLPHYANCDVVIVNQGQVAIPPAPNIRQADMELDVFFRETASCLGMEQ